MRWFAPLILVVAALAVAASAASATTGTTVRSKRGVYRVTVTPKPSSSPVGRLHTWSLMLRTAKGAPVTKARISVDGDMPEHGHGLPTQPRVRELGHGRYVVQGMKFQMGGFWYVRFAINARPGRDVARVEFDLPM
jgi:hypothetical protein